MKTWLVPSNDHIFRIEDSLKANNGITDWRQTNKFNVGDIVYIYKTKPEQSIRYKMEVIAVDIDEENGLQNEAFWTNKDIYYNGLGNVLYCRFKLLVEYNNEWLSYKHLRKHGVYNIHSSCVLNEETITYIDSVLNNDSSEVYYIDYARDVSELCEGVLLPVMANRYERNRYARQKCIDAKGCKCSVCGMDFEKIYGEIGRNFIEVHHVVPISSIGKDYVVNPLTDLVPVCSNCHAMLHRKPGKYDVYSVDELKQIIEKERE